MNKEYTCREMTVANEDTAVATALRGRFVSVCT